MKLFLGLLGAILGAMAGDAFGAILGAGLGVLVASLLAKDRSPPPAPAMPSAAAPAERSPVEQLQARVTALEQDVATLRLQVERLSAPGADAAQVPAPEAALVRPEAIPQRLEVPMPAEAPIEAAVDGPIDVPMPVPVPAEPVAPLTAAAPPWVEPLPPAEEPRPAAPPVVPAPTLEERLPPFLARLVFGGNTIVKVGVLILFLGLAFLLRYAAERVTVPVELRYAGVAMLGMALLALGWRLRDRKDAYGLILQGAGIGVFYLTTLAALKVSFLLPPGAAFAVLLAVTLLSALLAVVQNAPWLAFVAAAEGFAAPVLVSTGSGNHIALFSYLAVLDVGIVLMAWFKAWRPLNLIGAVGTFTLAAAWADKHYTDAVYPSTQAFLLLFFAMFTLVAVLFARRALALGDAPDHDQPLARRAASALATVGRVDSTLAFGVPLAAYGLQYLMVRSNEFGPAWAAVGFAAFYLLLGGALLRGGPSRYALLGEAQAIVGVIFATLAIPLALEGQWTGATWAIEAAGMYWLGARQQRQYARAFAMLVLAGAALRLFTTLHVDLTPGTPLLSGPVLGMLMLAAGALAMVWVGRRTPLGDREAAGAALPLWIGIGALATTAWLVLPPAWASVATSALALGCALLQSRHPLPALQAASGVLHAVALAGFASTLHTADEAAMLSSGWHGLVSATLIGTSLLVTAWLPLAAAMRQAEAQQTPPRWSFGSSVGMLAGLAVLSLSLLFVMPADQAARLWPGFGVLALWIGLRLAHPALAIGWLVLQLSAALAFCLYGPPLWSAATAGSTVWTPLVLALAGGVSGDLLQRARRQHRALPWPAAPWAMVLWSMGWWSQVLLPDLWRHTVRTQADWLHVWPVVLVGWITATSMMATALARWRDWRELGLSAWATVPMWACVAFISVGALDAAPHAHLGWLVWPLALAWHAALLRALPRWCTDRAVAPLHAGGFWLFLVLAALEAQRWTAGWGPDGSAWPLLGQVVVPAAVLAVIAVERTRSFWPLTAFRTTYLVVACAPVALYLLGWLWVGNTQPGTALPLPYVPLLNPLEVGQGLVLLALLAWQRALPAEAQGPRPLRMAVFGATAFALYTGMVLRSCHHVAGIPWDVDALFASTLTQAALSVAWAIVGVALMMAGHKRVVRTVWMVGAALLGVVVLKLFFVELADRGGLYRIVSFIVVGLLLLTVGYFAPVPPARKEAGDAA